MLLVMMPALVIKFALITLTRKWLEMFTKLCTVTTFQLADAHLVKIF